MYTDNEEMPTQIDNYKVLKELGTGIQSKVYLASDKLTGHKVAIKVFNFEHQHLIKQEVKVTQKFEHDNIIKYVGEGKTKLNGQYTKSTYLVQEYAPKGCLFDIVASQGELTEDFSRFYMRQLVEALQHIYQQGHVHRDLKLENMMLDEKFNLKLIDFGFAGDIKGVKNTGILNTFLGTPGYMAPEIFLKKGYLGEKVDSFALGVILFTLVMGRPPFSMAKSNDRFYRLINSNKQDAFWKIHAKAKDDTSSSEFKDLVMGLLTADQDTRLTLEQMSKHPWMAEGSVPDSHELVTEMDKKFEQACLEAAEI